ncbi:MAG: type II secretion system protein [Verrucomicrobiota bacterium]|nr:type II secretion system protein [Verrucomicrobiota bacterium]
MTFNFKNGRRFRQAFSMVEVLVAVGIIGIMFVSLYSGFSSGFAVVQLARENLRATQILQEKMETIRLYTWEQLNTPNFIPTNFLEDFYATTNANSGVVYTGSVTIAACPITEAYSNDLRQVTMKVQWESAGILRNREMITFVSRYGLQNYIY